MEEIKKEPDEKVLSWKAPTIKAFKQYLNFINPLVGSKKLCPMEINVLADFIYLDNLYKDIPKEVRNTILFSKETRKKIITHLGTSKDALNNVISSLYKKGYLSKDGKLLAHILINKNNEIRITLAITLITDTKDNFMLDFVSNESIQN